MKKFVLDIIKDNAENFPDEIAIRYENEQILYRQLVVLITDNIRELQKNGIVKNKHRVFLSGNNTIELIVLFLSLLALETDVFLVDPKSTKKEIEELLLTIPSNFMLLESEVFQDKFSSKDSVHSYQLIATNNNYQNTKSAFVNFFSTGSTGEPKAFGFSEEKLIRMVINLATHLNFNKEDKVLCPVSFTHSHGVMMSLPFLLLGASVHYLHPKHCHPENLFQYIQQHQVTIITGVPYQYNLMLENQTDLNALQSLRYLFCGSAPMSEYLAIQFEQKFGKKLNQAYGISEIGPICVNLFEEGSNNFQSVGKVIKNIEYKIADERDNEVVKGEEGELLVRSGFMTNGYINANSENLFRDGWMCTQDIVREDEHGNIFIVGRKSNFINVSGYKIYPVEVEKVLLNMKGIKDAIVMGERDDTKRQIIKAYITTFFPLMEEEVKNYCREYLSKFKIPHQIIFVDELPTNSIGKVITSKITD